MKRVNFFLKQKRSGFTLVEVLITLTIIGIVAALTIPIFIQNNQKDSAVAGVRKAQAILSQVFESFVADEMTMDAVFAGNSQSVNVLNQFATKLNVIKNCGSGTGCFPEGSYKGLNGAAMSDINQAGYGKAILADGTSIAIGDGNGGCDTVYVAIPENPLYNVCGMAIVDINGFNRPNQWGKDLFFFHVTRKGIFPQGSNGDAYVNTCTTSNTGQGCASKVITDGAVNY